MIDEASVVCGNGPEGLWAQSEFVLGCVGTALAPGAAWAYKWPILVSAGCWFVAVGSMELLAYPVKLALLPIGLSPPF